MDLDLVVRNLIQWERDKRESIVAYRDHAFRSPVDGELLIP